MGEAATRNIAEVEIIFLRFHLESDARAATLRAARDPKNARG
jgi:hypothetical protein